MENYLKNCALEVVDKKPLDYEVTKKERAMAQTIANLKRRQSFLLGRHHAHRLLKKYGLPQKTLAAEQNGAIAWPVGIKGSLSHSKKKIAICITNCKSIVALGVDLERTDRNPDVKIYPKISHHKENFSGLNSWEVLQIFCIKEAVIKCFGHLQQKVRFGEICVHSLQPCSFSIFSKNIFGARPYLTQKENHLLAAFVLRK
jgi:4'-phosphopantetheinyl transferase EntD